MTRLIDADALDRAMYHKSFEVDDGRTMWNSGCWIRYRIYEEARNEAPTVDAVPVIRCKECKYYRYVLGDIDGLCGRAEWYRRYQREDDYCSRAERKEE